MKEKCLPIFITILLLSLFSIGISAQDEQENLPADATPRKIFYTYNSTPVDRGKSRQVQKGKNQNTGKQNDKVSSTVRKKPQPGVQVKIELERSGIKQFVPANTVFYSGDKVRFYFKVNFPAYVAVFNQGSSGKVSLLFPCSGQKNLIQPHGAFRIPTGNFPFKFDNTAGEENLTFIMSSAPLAVVEQAVASGIDVCSQKFNNEFQSVLNEVNTAALGQGRDIVLSEDEDDDGSKAAYFLTSIEELKKLKGIRIKLRHE